MGRAPCCDKANVKRGPWSPEEDATLKAYLQAHGTAGNWIALPTKAGLKRCGKSCRLRWLNYLRPDIKHGGFTDEEDHKICNLFNQMGSRWSVIASHLPGRTDNDVKNYWNTKLKKKLLSGKISLTTNNTNTKNITASQIPTNINNNTFINHATPEFVKPPNNSCVPKLPEPGGSSSLLNRKAQNPAMLSILTDTDDNNDHGQTVHVQRLNLQHDQQSSLYSPRVFMDLLSDDQGFYNLVPKNTSHTQIMSLLSQDPAGSGTNTSDGINDNKLSNGCEEFGGTALADHFGFGLPYDIISNDHHGVVAPSYSMSTYFC